MSTIGVVGFGAMGGQIAARLLSHGKDVYGTGGSTDETAELVEQGLHWRDSPREVAETADVVLSVVNDGDAVTRGPDGILPV